MREDNDLSKSLISVAGSLVNLLVALILLLALLYLVLALIGVKGLNDLQTSADKINDLMTDSREIMTSLLTISVAALALGFLVMFVSWLSKDESSIIILPFEVPESETSYSGKALSHLLTAELLRIDRIKKMTYEGVAPIESENIYFPTLMPSSENVSSEIAKIGTLEAGTASIPLGQILISLKKMWPWGTNSKVISGCLQKFGSSTSLIACLEHQNMKIWESRKITDCKKLGDEIIPDLARDLAFMIVHELSGELTTEEKITSKTWQGFQHFFEALDAYHTYSLTGDIDNLERARTECLKSSNSEIGYTKLLELLYNLGVAYSNKKELFKAQELLLQAIKINPNYHPALLILGYLCGIQDQHDKALDYFDEALNVKPNDIYAINGKGVALYQLGRVEDALESFENVIKLDQDNLDALNFKGDVLLSLSRYEEALKCFEKSINLIQSRDKQ